MGKHKVKITAEIYVKASDIVDFLSIEHEIKKGLCNEIDKSNLECLIKVLKVKQTKYEKL